MPKHLIQTLIGMCLAVGLLVFCVPDGAFRDGLGAMQFALLLSAAYVYWKKLKS